MKIEEKSSKTNVASGDDEVDANVSMPPRGPLMKSESAAFTDEQEVKTYLNANVSCVWLRASISCASSRHPFFIF